MNKKNLLIAFLTLLIETIVTFTLSHLLSIRFIEFMFLIGLAFTVFIFWFSSSGGTVSNFIDSHNRALTQYIQERESFKIRRGTAFYASILYLFIGLIFFILLVSEIIPPVQQ